MSADTIHIIHRTALFLLIAWLFTGLDGLVHEKADALETLTLDHACIAYAADMNDRARTQGRTEPCPDPREAMALTGKGGAV